MEETGGRIEAGLDLTPPESQLLEFTRRLIAVPSVCFILVLRIDGALARLQESGRPWLVQGASARGCSALPGSVVYSGTLGPAASDVTPGAPDSMFLLRPPTGHQLTPTLDTSHRPHHAASCSKDAMNTQRAAWRLLRGVATTRRRGFSQFPAGNGPSAPAASIPMPYITEVTVCCPHQPRAAVDTR